MSWHPKISTTRRTAINTLAQNHKAKTLTERLILAEQKLINIDQRVKTVEHVSIQHKP